MPKVGEKSREKMSIQDHLYKYGGAIANAMDNMEGIEVRWSWEDGDGPEMKIYFDPCACP